MYLVKRIEWQTDSFYNINFGRVYYCCLATSENLGHNGRSVYFVNSKFGSTNFFKSFMFFDVISSRTVLKFFSQLGLQMFKNCVRWSFETWLCWPSSTARNFHSLANAEDCESNMIVDLSSDGFILWDVFCWIILFYFLCWTACVSVEEPVATLLSIMTSLIRLSELCF